VALCGLQVADGGPRAGRWPRGSTSRLGCSWVHHRAAVVSDAASASGARGVRRYCQPSLRTNSLSARDGLVSSNRLVLRCAATGAFDVGVLHNRGLVKDDRLRVT
jgi:hypothetical protein